MGTDPWFQNFGQISFGVPDLHDAVAFWQDQMGVGPWNIFYGLTFAAEFEGRPISFPFNVAVGWHDGRVVELMQVVGDGPSPLHDALNRPIVGLQRLASVTSNIERDAETAERAGLERYASGEANGQRFIYFRSMAAPGVILELLERTEEFAALCRELEARAQSYATRRATPPVGATPAASPPTVPATMRAVEIDGYGGTERLLVRDVPVPVPGPGEVRIRVSAAAVNPVDAKLRSGLLKEGLPLTFPARLGGDAAGTIDAVGGDVHGFVIGDRVAAQVAPGRSGTYAEWVIAPAATTVLVPDAMDLEAAAALPTGALTGIQLIEVGVRPAPGARVLIAGANGSVGRAAVITALDAGAEVYAGVRGTDASFAADLPVKGIVNLSDPMAAVAAGPFDAVADTIGGEAGRSLFSALKPDGIFASVAMPPLQPPQDASQHFCLLIARFDGPRLERYMRTLARSNIAVPVAHRLALEEAVRAHELIEAGGVGGKILLRP